MIALSAGIEASLRASEDAPRRVLLIRHGDRHSSTPGTADEALELTELGESRASLLGRRLGEGPRWALTSPIQRCRRTVELAGFDPEESALLGAPGPFVVDRAAGREVFRAHGTHAVVRAQIRGETWGCMRPLAEGARMVVEALRSRLECQPGVGLAVSHDAIVLPVLAWVTGDTFVDRWLDPLDGAVLTPEALFWEGRRFEVRR